MNLAEQFFDERELTFSQDAFSDSNGDSSGARAWYDELKGALDKLPIYPHDNFGQYDGRSDSGENLAFFFRGQSRSDYAFTSTLYRNFLSQNPSAARDAKPEPTESTLLQAEKAVLESAWSNGIGRGLTPLERLTLLQHHGVPTRLIDVSTDWKVALYFACSSNLDKDGRLFLIATNWRRWREFPNATGKKRSSESNKPTLAWEDKTLITRDDWYTGTWPILLPFSDPRMIAQSGFFLVGGIPRPTGNYHLYASRCKDCCNIVCDNPAHKHAGRTNIERPPMTNSEIREVSSCFLKFPGSSFPVSNLTAQKADNALNTWSAVGYTCRVPSAFKRDILRVLGEEGLNEDSIFPPFAATTRLLGNVVNQKLKL
ncbi:FRG domain-containing protein [uncultured Corynebacterium sp.]|uniref:FRG domain-containing protein n=1 Tax=uncultured Corynebacterium sp. TaxID=159447 RepID=UPI00288A9BC9|nr:FRG domain-containing protein [uncultured Corynebacterium sp.]